MLHYLFAVCMKSIVHINCSNQRCFPTKLQLFLPLKSAFLHKITVSAPTFACLANARCLMDLLTVSVVDIFNYTEITNALQRHEAIQNDSQRLSYLAVSCVFRHQYPLFTSASANF